MQVQEKEFPFPESFLKATIDISETWDGSLPSRTLTGRNVLLLHTQMGILQFCFFVCVCVCFWVAHPVLVKKEVPHVVVKVLPHCREVCWFSRGRILVESHFS